MKLIDAPVGVFRYNGELVLKTEYMSDCDGVYIPNCYILSTGEKFWGGMKSLEDFKTKFNSLEVETVDVQPELRWIPCSKNNMPEDGQLIYASFPYLHCCKVMEYSPYIRDAIDAWIPLPEPYKGETI